LPAAVCEQVFQAISLLIHALVY